MKFRAEVRMLRETPFNEDAVDTLFDKHVEEWHAGTSPEKIWEFLDVSLEEYSDLVTTGDGAERFFQKVCQE